MDSQVQCRAQIESAPDQQTNFGGLRGIELVLRTVVATATIGRIRAQTGFAQFITPERPVDEITQGGSFGPLPG